jgi:ABC-type bacteriocin/lantibiotic exporter with double-glycine peptidase domain
MKRTTIERVEAFVSGASWAFVVASVFFVFKSLLLFGFSLAFLGGFIALFFSLFIILLLDYFRLQQQKLKEIKKQTDLLEQISKNLSGKDRT